MEVRHERAAWFDGDDLAVVLPDLLETRRQQAVALGGRGLGLAERGEVRQQPLGLGELRIGGRRVEVYQKCAKSASSVSASASPQLGLTRS